MDASNKPSQDIEGNYGRTRNHGNNVNENNTADPEAGLARMQTYSTILGPSDADFNPEAV